MIQINPREPAHTHRLTLAEFEAFCDPDTFPEISAQLVERAGGGVPHVEPVTELATEPAPALAVSQWGATVHDADAEARIKAQHAALIAGGVKVEASQQFFATGTRMASEGYAAQAARKAEHEAKLPARDAASALRAAIVAEHRTDREVSAREFAASLAVNGKISAFGFALTEQAIRGLAGRLESPMLGYVLGLRERCLLESRKPENERDAGAIKADKAKIAEILHHECMRAPDVALKLRTRNSARNDIFAILSPGYAPADAPEVLDQIVDGLPSDAKGSWAYDPTSTSWELRASVWTPTPVAEQAVGEPFEGYASFQSRDNGTSRLNGGGGITLIRCLNASTYVADGASVSRVHRGGILVDVAKALEGALAAIDVLCQSWGASKVEVVAPEGVPVEQLIPGFWRGLFTARKSELAKVLPGRREEHVRGLTEAFESERRYTDRIVRSDFAQGWTKYIQDQPTPVRREAEAAIGAWLVKDHRPMTCDLG
jgi:hypothetical protein